MTRRNDNSTAVILAYWRHDRKFDTAADILFMWLCEQTFSYGYEEVAATRKDLSSAIGRRLTATTLAIKNLINLGVVARRPVAGGRGFLYRIDQEAVLNLSK